MFCPTCGTQNQDIASFCTRCGRPFSPADLRAAPPPPPPPPSSASADPASPQSTSAAAAPAPQYAPAPPPPPRVYPPLPGGSAYLPASAQAKPKRIGIFVIVAIVAAAIVGLGFAALKLETTEQKMARLMREAAGLQPVRHTIFGEDKTDARLRNFFKDIINVNKEYQQSVDQLDTSETKKLNTPASFADPDLVSKGLEQLHAAYDLDALQEQRLNAVLEKFRQGLNDLPASERQEMLKGFNEGLAKAMPTRQRAVSAEKSWIDSLDAAYSYAQSYHSAFTLSNGHLAISNNAVREEFNNRIHNLNARRTEFLQAKSAFDQMQRQNLQKVGVSREQTGLR